ncbi:uncharacterized protein J7T54_002084 [Emericellopsis cladophorae]|uniref:RBR-type E3 ubiquitin transferase n=1 Tax=Emericellopsis cladophorae TaxID=2686198 RepID=A0A9P9Y4G1_9HYPO|nr:uncharacterized protein J7T54_002084 [Emericellopsis cladophorae]KAI6782925.1 hypothetical protein J7T54_002084 [Emericellopsis cladophorae]
MDENEELRTTELEALEAIYPEIRRPDAKDHFTFEIDLPVQPAAPVTVTFPAAATGNDVDTGVINPVADADSLQVSHLPALRLRITLPDGYPSDKPPEVYISTDPQWLRQETLASLSSDGPRLWEDMGRDMVAYTYIDHVQRAADDVFGAISEQGTLEVDAQYKLAVLDYDIKSKAAAFDRETFDCGICLDPKKGTKCHKMLDCGHIFCLQCLQDFYNDAIQQGSIGTVRCLMPSCAKERSAAQQATDAKRPKKPKTSISPSELLQIGLTEDTVKRYVMLKYKTELESDKNTVYCPRQWCNGAARSKKHKKPTGLDYEDASDAESDQDDEQAMSKTYDRAERLAICEDCGLAFCSRCLQTWHGEFVVCAPRRADGELTEEDKASLEYLQLHTSPCPTCSAPAQKTHGCNHMICSRCETHFCYLCSAWLSPGNPYQHYNEQPGGKFTSCYMRLWELEGGDGDDVGLGFLGGNRLPQEAANNDEAVVEEAPQPIRMPDIDRGDQPARPQLLHENGRPVAVAREAPLVLRLGIDPNNPPRPPPPPVHQAAVPQAPVVAGRGRGRGAAQGRGGRGRGGRGGGAERGRGRARPQPAMRVLNNGNHGMMHDGLDAAQQAWIRQFVEMALLDEEDMIAEDGLGDDAAFFIR